MGQGDPGIKEATAILMAVASLMALVPALVFVGTDLLASRPAGLAEGQLCEPSPQVVTGQAGRGLVLRYQAPGGQFVRLGVEPFQVGSNLFRIGILDRAGKPAAASRIRLGFYRLENNDPPDWVEATPPSGATEYRFTRPLDSTGWWVVAVAVDNGEPVLFVLRLDQPSRAPLEFAPPNYPVDPAAEGLFWRTLRAHRGLRSVRWEEQLTSGLAYPSELGAWVFVEGQAEAPDRFSLRVVNPDRESYDVFQAGTRRCTRTRGEAWPCAGAEPRNALDFRGPGSATGFRFGREEAVGGELTRVVLFYEPVEKSWYAWWVGLETGYLRRMAMVGPGHFMVTRYFDQNVPVELAGPSTGG